MEQIQYTKDFKKSIFDNSIDISANIMEIPIDEIFNNEALKEIPIIKSAIGIASIINSVKQRNSFKNFLIFIQSIDDGSVAPEKIEKYKKKLENDKKCRRELEKIIIYLDNFISNRKSIILANLFKRYVNEEYNINFFFKLADIINFIMLHQLDVLKNNTKRIENTLQAELTHVEKNMLNSFGLLQQNGSIVFSPKTKNNLSLEGMYIYLAYTNSNILINQ